MRTISPCFYILRFPLAILWSSANADALLGRRRPAGTVRPLSRGCRGRRTSACARPQFRIGLLQRLMSVDRSSRTHGPCPLRRLRSCFADLLCLFACLESTKIRGVKRRDHLPFEGRAGVRGRRLDVSTVDVGYFDPTDLGASSSGPSVRDQRPSRRQPAARASASVQKYFSPRDGLIRVRS